MADTTQVTTSQVSGQGHRNLPHLRWWICALLFCGSTVNYIDRGTIAILAPHLQQIFHITEADYGWIIAAFMWAYAIFMLVSGGIVDWLGTRIGYAISMGWWGLATIGHALARGVFSFGAARFMLGAGEAGNFPASIKAVAEWFPKRERALATGIFNSGTNIGNVIAYPVVGVILLHWGWQAAFIVTGILALIIMVVWLAVYRTPRLHPWLSLEELKKIQVREPGEQEEPETKIEWRRLLAYRQAWGFTVAKFLTDPIWWFYVFWLPKYLVQARGFSIQQLEWFGTIPFIAAIVGSVGGGWLSGFLIRKGWSVNAGRKTAMAVCAFSMPAGIAAVLTGNVWLALALISVSTSAHQGWSANLFTLSSDIFPKRDVASVVGIGGAAGAVGGMIIAPLAGYLLQFTHSYVLLFIICGTMHPIALGLVHLIIPQIKPITHPARG
ncbi:MAG TPA: MFS transporter [Terriglobia bacterium]|nr:MFS transporter [Terriglobia bacterium]